MFENNYKKQMDSIVPDEELKAKIKESFYRSSEKKYRKTARIYRIGLAVAACIAIAVSVILIPKNTDNGFTETPAPQNAVKGYLETTDNYDTLYTHFKKLKSQMKNYGDGFYLYTEEYEYVYDEETKYGDQDIGTDSLAKPGTSAGEGKNESVDVTDDADFSETNNQVAGVDEADIIKTDGKYIYSLYKNRVCITRANGKDTKKLSEILLSFEKNEYYKDMYISNNRIIVMGTISRGEQYSTEETLITVIDISDKNKPDVINIIKQSGYYHSSRLIDGTVYVISEYSVSLPDVNKECLDSFIPYSVYENGDIYIAAPGCIRFEKDIEGTTYIVASSYDVQSGELLSNCSVLGKVNDIYCSTNNIITTSHKYRNKNGISENYTLLSRFSIKDKKIEYVASSEVNGTPLNQFSVDEYNGYFRIVTTVNSYTYYENTKYDSVSMESRMSNCLYVLNDQLKIVGSIENIAPDERVYSVRFMGKIAYFVTFRQVDPLFSVDLSDPENPVIIGSLKIPGFSDYLYPYGDGLLLGIGCDADEETGRVGYMKLSMFDISDPANVTENAVTLLDGIYESPALSEHKATLVSANKNLIGFGIGKDKDSKWEPSYRVYSYENGEFNLLAELPLTNGDEFDHNLFDSLHYSRGLFIGDNLYIVNEIGVWVYDINSMQKITNIKF